MTDRLDQLAMGDRAVVAGLTATGALRRRLLEMGFVTGEIIRADRVAPFGNPVAYEIKGYRVALRRTEAAMVRIAPCNGANAK